GGDRRSQAEESVREFSQSQLKRETGVDEATIRSIAAMLTRSKRPLVIAEGLNCSDPHAAKTAAAANLLCSMFPGSRSLIDFADYSSLSLASPLARVGELAERMNRGEVDLLLLDGVNPVFHLPAAWGFSKGMKAVPMTVSFSSAPDDTAEYAKLVLPTHTFYETWGDYSPRAGVRSILQPTMGPLWDSRPLEDILISTGKTLGGEKNFPWKDSYELLREAWTQGKSESDAEAFWQESVMRGGRWPEETRQAPSSAGAAPAAKGPFPPTGPLTPPPRPGTGFSFMTYPTIQFYDGRTANRPFLQELPDPMTQVTWGGWIEVNPQTAWNNKIKKGDVLRLKSRYGVVEAPAFLYQGIPENVLAMPIGQGHASGGRYTKNDTGNPAQVIPSVLDPESGGLYWSVSGVTIEKTGKFLEVANVDGSMYQHGRGIAQSLDMSLYRKGIGDKPDLVMPLPEGYKKEVDFYPAHVHDEYRWSMVIDLDRCIGCGACVVACYAENNVPWVGKKTNLMKRRMSWLQIER
ncbi:MAG TPA: molybdopterin dinucleotide binding domain-containing protein, partial [Thermodesulfobacteriota bacterium]|nr:molybdopterin dinucleotide binding domain-containing protein [Thermodesulfobacteriota bacterium]